MFDTIIEYLKSLGYKAEDIQADDPGVGIPEGWVIFDNGYELREISYSDADYHSVNKSEKSAFLKDSSYCVDV